MMYELLTGLVPYKGDNAVEIALKHLKEPLPSVRKKDPSIPQSIENVILKATAKNPKNRYTDAREMHQDLKTALDEARKDEPRHVYKYAESESDDAKKAETIKKGDDKVKETKTTKKVKKQVEEDDDEDEERRGHKALIFFVGLFTALVLVTTIIATIYFDKNGQVENILVPDVSGMSVVDASNTLTDVGFEVETEYKYVYSDDVVEGNVVKTSPEIGTKRKSGSKIVLYVSSGEGVYVLQDFSGQNYLEVKGKIETECNCNVVVETKTVAESKKVKEDTVLETVPKAGESIKLGEQITIIIPDVQYKYPDFTSGYTLAKIEAFCKKHEINLEVKYQESSTLKEGTIIKQSRAAKSVVTPGATLVITISSKPAEKVNEDGETDNNTGE